MSVACGVVLVAVGGLMVWKGLDAADKIGSVIGALSGVIGLGLAAYGVVSTRRAGPTAPPPVSNTVEDSTIGGSNVQIGHVGRDARIERSE
ncbi:hypothetical protein [Actinophytocola sp.]|uniref:hypothetical protein n=1 Tax=Actinophytocola sp. TaxID=1872138 RepID=UPI00389B027D